VRFIYMEVADIGPSLMARHAAGAADSGVDLDVPDLNPVPAGGESRTGHTQRAHQVETLVVSRRAREGLDVGQQDDLGSIPSHEANTFEDFADMRPLLGQAVDTRRRQRSASGERSATNVLAEYT
jgi:hypothetical protein